MRYGDDGRVASLQGISQYPGAPGNFLDVQAAANHALRNAPSFQRDSKSPSRSTLESPGQSRDGLPADCSHLAGQGGRACAKLASNRNGDGTALLATRPPRRHASDTPIAMKLNTAWQGKTSSAVSVVLPAKNEAASLEQLLPKLLRACQDAEIIVVDDGSTDATAEISQHYGAKVVRHPYSMGNGAAVKSGARAANGEILVFMDADGQHDPADIARLLQRLRRGYDMVVGSRSKESQASIGRGLANELYNRLASYVTGKRIVDLTSGFRAVRADKFREFLYLFPNGFSYPTTSTIAFFRAGYSVAYEPIEAAKRIGKSHIHPLQDGLRFLLIIFKIGTLYSPLKLFCPVSAAFLFIGLVYYVFTYATAGRFTNMGVVMFTTAVLVFLIGLVSEQITQLIYRPTDNSLAEVYHPAELEDRVRETGT